MGASRRLRRGIKMRELRAWRRATITLRHDAKMAAKAELESFTPAELAVAEVAERPRRRPGVPYGTRDGERIHAA